VTIFAFARHWLRRPALPPGDLIDLEGLERADRLALLDRAAQYGPVFKGLLEQQFGVCILGIDRCRRILREHADQLQPATIDLSKITPAGFLRQMRGAVHHDYRVAVVAALQATDMLELQASDQQLVQLELLRYAECEDSSADAYLTALNKISTRSLLHLFFGAPPGSNFQQRLYDLFLTLGPYGLVWNIEERQRQACNQIVSALQQALEMDQCADNSVLANAEQQGALDEVLLVNLIYMVEMGRYDLRALLRWLTKHASNHPQAMAAMRTEVDSGRRGLAEAFVLETLRTDQSERLMRRCHSDIVFDGYRIPKGTLVRLCMWESHHDTQQFNAPLRFDPLRFVPSTTKLGDFAPFGLDRHKCPVADVATSIGITFLRALASFELQALDDSAPVRGAYHWEPSSEFSVRLGSKLNS